MKNKALKKINAVKAKYFLDCPVSVVLHKSLNTCRGVISEPDLLTTTDAEILDGFSGQGVIQSLQLLNLLHQLRPSKSQPPTSVIDTAPTTSNSLSISAASSSSTACSVLETSTTTSNTIPTISQDTTQTSKPRRKKRPPKNQSNSIKPKIDIKTAPHRPQKPAPTEYSMDEEDMIVYDVEDEPELNPKYNISYKGEIVKGRNGAYIRTATAGSDVVQSGRPIFDDFFQHLWPYIGNNTANVVFQIVKRLWLIRIDQ
ncbi:hypothetical protein TNCV_3013691 [Trichonephila clavipes]|nr:hypothetical protein TNCV_3013691 [Trichonephila clavipes]